MIGALCSGHSVQGFGTASVEDRRRGEESAVRERRVHWCVGVSEGRR